MNPEDLLTDTLRERTEGTDYPSTPISTVTARARTLRARRRRTTALAAAAAVAVVVVPSALWWGRSPGTSPDPTQRVSPSPTVSTSPLPSMDLTALPHGPRPGIDYLIGNTLEQRYGGPVTSPAFRRASTVLATGRGALVSVPPEVPTSGIESTLGSVLLVSGGTTQVLGCGSDRFALSADGTMSAYWVARPCPVSGASRGRLFSGQSSTMGESGPGWLPTSTGLVEQPVGLLKGDVATNASHVDGSPAGVWIFGVGIAPRRVPGMVRAGGVSPDGMIAGSLGDGRSAVVEPLSGHVRWSAPSGWQLGRFSADGRYVLGIQPTDSSFDEYAVFDAASGRRLLRFADAGAPVWDTDDTLLSVERAGDAEAVVRTDLQGHRSLATPLVHLGPGGAGYRLATRP